MIYIVKDKKVIYTDASSIKKQIEDFMKEEEVRKLKELIAVQELHEKAEKKLVRKREK